MGIQLQPVKEILPQYIRDFEQKEISWWHLKVRSKVTGFTLNVSMGDCNVRFILSNIATIYLSKIGH